MRVILSVLSVPALLVGCYSPQGGAIPESDVPALDGQASEDNGLRLRPTLEQGGGIQAPAVLPPDVPNAAPIATPTPGVAPPPPVGMGFGFAGGPGVEQQLAVLGGSVSGTLGARQVDGASVEHFGALSSYGDGASSSAHFQAQVITTGDNGSGMLMLVMDGNFRDSLRGSLNALEAGEASALVETREAGTVASVIGCSGPEIHNWDWDVSTEDMTVELSPVDGADAVMLSVDASFLDGSQGQGQIMLSRTELLGALDRL